MTEEVLDPDALARMISSLRDCFSGPSSLADDLPNLFDALRSVGLIDAEHTAPTPVQIPAVSAMIDFLDSMRGPLQGVDASGLLSDPWAASGLRCDEVRNASALRWFLDPRAGHGCADVLLADLSKPIRSRQAIFRVARPPLAPFRSKSALTVTARAA